MTRNVWKEQRRHPRVGLVRSILLRLEGTKAPLPAQLIDLSEGGLRAVAPLSELTIGAHVTADLQIPGRIGSKTISLPALVVRVGEPTTGARHREFALELRPQPDAVSRMLGAFVRRALKAQQKLAAVQGSESPLADALRMVRVSLGPPKPDRARVVLVTSAVPGEGKSFTAGHLAALLASEGQRVLLVDTDLRNPTLDVVFGAAPGPGLADWLADGAEVPVVEFVQPTRAGVALLSAGQAGLIAEGWSREDALAMVERLRAGDFDYVVLDSAPLLIAASSSLLAAAADDVLLVARSGMTRERDLVDARRMLERHGANLRGVVLNDQDDSRPNEYKDYYRTSRRALRGPAQREPERGDGVVYELVKKR
jgi:capsular exopolysaccharide synthesis family protein